MPAWQAGSEATCPKIAHKLAHLCDVATADAAPASLSTIDHGGNDDSNRDHPFAVWRQPASTQDTGPNEP